MNGYFEIIHKLLLLIARLLLFPSFSIFFFFICFLYYPVEPGVGHGIGTVTD